MKFNNVRGIVWDLDGTLIDSFSVFEKILNTVAKETRHVMPSHEAILHNYHGTLGDSIRQLLSVDSEQELDELVSLFLHYQEDIDNDFFEDASKLVRTAARKGLFQAVVTNRAHSNNGKSSPKHIIANSSLADYIHEVRASDEVEYRKPDKRSINDWLVSYNLRPSEVLVIGDQIVDAKLAINLASRAVIVRRNGFIPHLNSDIENYKDIVLVDSLEEITLG